MEHNHGGLVQIIFQVCTIQTFKTFKWLPFSNDKWPFPRLVLGANGSCCCGGWWISKPLGKMMRSKVGIFPELGGNHHVGVCVYIYIEREREIL